MRFLFLILLIISIIAATIFFVNKFFIPILPAPYNSDIIFIVVLIVSVTSFLGTLNDTVELFDNLKEKKNRKLLIQKLSRGPYDKPTIYRATKYYIRPKCSNIDPAQEAEIRKALLATKEDLFKKVTEFLDNTVDSKRHLLILADSGMGKTSFVLNYYAFNEKRKKRERHKLAIVPLGIKDAEEMIRQIQNREDTILFLDALDEDTKAIEEHKTRMLSLMELCHQFKKIVITCRTQFFPKDEEIPVETGIIKIGPVKAGEKKDYEFWKLYLSPFDDNDVENYLKRRFPIWYYKKRKIAKQIALKISLLSVRPMLLAHIPEVVEKAKVINFSYQLYEMMINAWLERECHWVDKTTLRDFSEKLAVDLYVNKEKRGMERIGLPELESAAKNWTFPLEKWQLSGRSLLNRDAEGNYKFAHRSIMEYLYIFSLLNGEKAGQGELLTDQMKVFLAELIGSDFNSYRIFSSFFKENNISVEVVNNQVLPSQFPLGYSSDISYAYQDFYNIITSVDIEEINFLTHLSRYVQLDRRKRNFSSSSYNFNSIASYLRSSLKESQKNELDVAYRKYVKNLSHKSRNQFLRLARYNLKYFDLVLEKDYRDKEMSLSNSFIEGNVDPYTFVSAFLVAYITDNKKTFNGYFNEYVEDVLIAANKPNWICYPYLHDVIIKLDFRSLFYLKMLNTYPFLRIIPTSNEYQYFILSLDANYAQKIIENVKSSN